MIRSVAIDMVDCEELYYCFSAAFALSTVGANNLEFQRPSFGLALFRYFILVLSGVFATVLAVLLSIVGFPVPGAIAVLFDIFFSMLLLISEIFVVVLVLALHDFFYDTLAISFVPLFLAFGLWHNKCYLQKYYTTTIILD